MVAAISKVNMGLTSRNDSNVVPEPDLPRKNPNIQATFYSGMGLILRV